MKFAQLKERTMGFREELRKWAKADKEVGKILAPLLKQAGNYSDLDQYAVKSFNMLKRPGESSRETSTSVAYAVGSFAKREGYTKQDLQKWLQGAYGYIFVKLNNLDPGMDLKEVRDAMFKAFDRARGG